MRIACLNALTPPKKNNTPERAIFKWLEKLHRWQSKGNLNMYTTEEIQHDFEVIW